MTQKEFILEMIEDPRSPYRSEAAATDALEYIKLKIAELCIDREERVVLTNFGSFQISKRKGYIGKNPYSQESIKLGPSFTLNFSTARSFREKKRKYKKI